MHAAVFVSSISKTIIIGLRQRRNAEKTAHRHRFAPTARCKKNPPIIIGLRQRRNPKKTAEERFNMLARGWLA
uniref:hypothetical protein n=1 Tax=Candidatus Limisoma sp. TaxID=3076476 RepID=UPI00402840AC